MNEVLHIYQKNRVPLNHVITHLDLTNEKPVEIFRSNKWIINQVQLKKKSQSVK